MSARKLLIEAYKLRHGMTDETAANEVDLLLGVVDIAGFVVVPKERWIGASAYSSDLQRIIEALCERRPLPEPKTSARFHYDMAQKFLQAKEAGE